MNNDISYRYYRNLSLGVSTTLKEGNKALKESQTKNKKTTAFP
tara:strand:- start:110 stop:238 length:129 start_codon:yes stop_codon:yes gene_type:complete